MTKTEVISAINETIRTNGNKGITADSLALILNEIVNLSPEEQEEEPSYDILSASLVGVENESGYNSIIESGLPEGVTVAQALEIFESIVAENKTIFDKAKNLILTGKTPILINSYKFMTEVISSSGQEMGYMKSIIIDIDYHSEISYNILEDITNENAEIPDFIAMVTHNLLTGSSDALIFTEDGHAWYADMFVEYYNNL